MAANKDKRDQWEDDIERSVAYYNEWYTGFAPEAFTQEREAAEEAVRGALKATDHMRNLNPDVLMEHPEFLPVFRACTAPRLAQDRLKGLAGVKKSLIDNMEKEDRISPSMDQAEAEASLNRILSIVANMADPDVFPWLDRDEIPTEDEARKAEAVIADRLTSARAGPIIRNAQERRQLDAIGGWLRDRGYTRVEDRGNLSFDDLSPGQFAFRLNVPGERSDGKEVNVPVDVVVMPKSDPEDALPILIEAKSAGDFTNVNKRRKEEADKKAHLVRRHGEEIRYVLFLCGYFDEGYLEYEASESIDWVWEHRLSDLSDLGL